MREPNSLHGVPPSVGSSAAPRVQGGRTIPHYRPASYDAGNPFALAIWLGAWTPGGPMDSRYRVSAGRLWVDVKGFWLAQDMAQGPGWN